MKLTDVRIDGFGVWNGLELCDLSPTCTVFYGANEAGKTTLLQFLRAALYGFSPARRSRYLPPVHGGLASGAISALDRSDGRIRIVRSEHENFPQGVATVESSDGTTQSNVDLQRLLHDVDETTFNNVFAVGLRELQELGTLTDLDASKWLYSLTAGLDRVSLAEVLSELESSRLRIDSGDGSRCELSELIADRNRLTAEIAQLSILPREHAQLVNDQVACKAAIATAEQETAACEAEHRVIEAAAVVYELCQRRKALNSQIAALVPPDQWPTGSLQRMNRLVDSMRLYRQKIKKLTKRRQKLAAEAATISVNELLSRQAPRVAALAEHEAWILSIEQELSEAQSTVAQWAGEQQTQQGRMKNVAADSMLASAQVDDRGWALLRSLGENLSKARRRAKVAKQRQAAQRGDADSAYKKLETALASRGHRDLTTAVEAAGNRVTHLRRRVQLEERIEQLTGAKADLEAELNSLEQRQMMPVWMTWTLGAVFVLGIVMILGGLVFSSWGWPVFIVGCFASLIAGGTKLSRDLSISTRLREAEHQMQLADSQLEDDTAEQAELDELLPKSNGNWAAQLAAAERDLGQLEQLLPLDSQQKSAIQSAGNADEVANQAKRRYRKARNRWRAALASQGLPTELTPSQVREMSLAGNQLRGVEGRLKDARSDVDRHRRELAGLSTQIEQVFLAAGLTPQSEVVSQRLKQLRGELTQNEIRRQRRDAVAKLRAKLRRRQAAIRRRIEQLVRRRRLLLRDCQVADIATFRRRAEETATLAALIADRDVVSREIASLLAGVTTEEAAEALIAGKSAAEVEATLSAAAKKLAAARDLHRQHCERLGQLNEQIRTITANRQLAAKRFELHKIERKLSAAVERWQVLSVTRGVLLSVKEDYERNRQPETLREASEYLAELTRGHYQRVWTRFGENALLVDDAEGRPLAVDVLSCGTREQLFLSLRLALVSLFARRGIELPMILDDVLVNFDAKRAAAAVRVLRKFAERGHQLLVFTCHEHIARLFKLKGVDVRRLPNNAVGGRDLPFEIDMERPQRKKLRVRELPTPEPEPEPEFVPEYLPAEEHFIVTAEAPAGQVEVRLVEPPEAPLLPDPEPEPVPEVEPLPVVAPIVELPPPVKVERKPKRRLDPPHRTYRWSTIRRGWNAEEFSGELDDQINPRWLQDMDSIGLEEPAEVEPPPPAKANPPMRIIHPKLGARSFKLLTDDGDDDTPLVVELTDDDLEADKLA